MTVEEVLATLTPKEEKVIRLRYGLLNGEEKTFEEIGKEIGLTRERARQITARALRKLGHPTRTKKLWPYIRLLKNVHENYINYLISEDKKAWKDKRAWFEKTPKK